ncbi:SecY protein transport family protein [Forsythia ovata]|uniref:SecY protein transport family protein n=1 Tax=Forsythia ovata TaxID=205694 RepID=A0ABD1R6Q8_9LAMI
MSSKRAGGRQDSYPIKLFHTSNMPIILQSALVSNLYFISQLVHSRYSGNFLVNLFGKWKESIPVGGLAYYVTAPSSLADMATDPIRAILYIALCSLSVPGSQKLGLMFLVPLPKMWPSSLSAHNMLLCQMQFKEQQLVMPGHRDSNLEQELNRYIPISAQFGGMCIGALTVSADFMGAIGSGTGILLAVTVVYQYFETFKKEKYG